MKLVINETEPVKDVYSEPLLEPFYERMAQSLHGQNPDVSIRDCRKMVMHAKNYSVDGKTLKALLTKK